MFFQWHNFKGLYTSHQIFSSQILEFYSFFFLSKYNNTFVSLLAGEECSSPPGRQEKFFIVFNVYPYIPNEAIFHLIYFQSSSKISKLDTFFELSYPTCCDALKYFFLHFKIKQTMHHLLGFPISP